MSDALRHVMGALEGGSEGEAAAVLRALGVEADRRLPARETPRTPLPPPGGSTAVHSEVEWV
ncbi:hypothetical protein OG885_29810 [Streptomyces sp. NBC_00028]|uniref:hypothetical protein n=1 Tax=Streptomyces sp. NBC_00028 TaxID=2975624 RepID=UPI00324958B0